MKKILRRIVLFVLGIVLCYQHFCYADVVNIGIIDVSTGILSIYFIPIGISVLIIVLLSYFTLRREATKGQEINNETTRKINFNKKLIFIIIAILVMMINFYMNACYAEYYPEIFLLSISVLIVLAIILRLKEKKKIAYIIMTIAIIMTGIMTTYSHISKKEAEEEEWKERVNAVGFATDFEINLFNEQFIPYEGKEVEGRIVHALIQKVVSNNAGNTDDELMQVTVSGVVTLNKEDTQLPEQFDEIKLDKTYNVNMIYNKYGKLESIHIEENQ